MVKIESLTFFGYWFFYEIFYYDVKLKSEGKNNKENKNMRNKEKIQN